MSPRAAWRLERLGFAEVYDYEAGKQDWSAAGLPVEGTAASKPRAGDVALRHAPTCGLDERVGVVRARAEAAGLEACVAVNEAGVVLGMLRRTQLDGDPGSTVELAMRPGPSTFRPNVPIEEMAEYMTKHDLANVPITRSDGTLVGLLLRDDAVRVAHEGHAGDGDHGDHGDEHDG
jgi:CBS domain-containing protein